MSKLTLEDAISHCLEVAKHNEYLHKRGYAGGCNSHDCLERAIIHRQLAEWLTELKQWRRVYGVCPSYEMCIPECKEGYNAQIAEYKRLLKAAVEDFAKLDRENTKVRNCMMPDMDCADCPLNWDSVDDSVEPCHNWRYTNEALALIGEDTNVPASADGKNVGHKSGGWISCKDRMPEESGAYICTAKSAGRNIVTFVKWQPRYKQWNLTGARSYWQITHWQPLPEPPKDGDA